MGCGRSSEAVAYPTKAQNYPGHPPQGYNNGMGGYGNQAVYSGGGPARGGYQGNAHHGVAVVHHNNSVPYNHHANHNMNNHGHGHKEEVHIHHHVHSRENVPPSNVVNHPLGNGTNLPPGTVAENAAVNGVVLPVSNVGDQPPAMADHENHQELLQQDQPGGALLEEVPPYQEDPQNFAEEEQNYDAGDQNYEDPAPYQDDGAPADGGYVDYGAEPDYGGGEAAEEYGGGDDGGAADFGGGGEDFGGGDEPDYGDGGAGNGEEY